MDTLEDVFGSAEPETTEDEIVEETTANEVEAEEVEETEVTDTEAAVEDAQIEQKQPPEDKHDAPMAALIDERNKRKEYENRVKQLEAERSQWEQSQRSSNTPDPYDDPEGFAKLVEERATATAEQRLFAYKLEDSFQRAAASHGEDVVETAKQWAMQHGENNPAFEADFYAQRDPIEWIVQQHNRHSMLSEFETDPKAWALKYVQEHGLLQTDATAVVAEVQKQEASVKRPKSLASVAGSSTKKDSRTKSQELNDLFDNLAKR